MVKKRNDIGNVPLSTDIQNSCGKEFQEFENLPTGLIIQSADGTVIYDNLLAREYLGNHYKEFFGLVKPARNGNFLNAEGKTISPDELPPVVCLHSKRNLDGVIIGILDQRDNNIQWFKIDAIIKKDYPQKGQTSVFTFITKTTKRNARKNRLLQQEKILEVFSNLYRLADTDEKKTEALYKSFIQILPNIWQYPRSACCKLEINGKVFQTKNYRDTTWQQISEIVIDEKKAGKLIIGYLENFTGEDEGPFLKEERELIDLVSETIGINIKKRRNQLHNYRDNEINISALGSTNLGVIRWDNVRNLVHLDAITQKHFGCNKEDLETQEFLRFIHPDDRKKVIDSYKPDQLIDFQKNSSIEFRVRKPDGSITWLSVESNSKYKQTISGPIHISSTSICYDITEHKVAAEAALQKTRAFRLLSECNETLVKYDNEESLLQDICRILVNTGGYEFCWIGFIEETPTRLIHPAASFGIDETYLDLVNPSLNELGDTWSPSETAVKTNRPCIVHNIHKDTQFANWSNLALKSGFKSAIALPIHIGWLTIGVLSILSNTLEVFDPDEVSLIEKITSNLSYSIESLRAKSIQESLEKDLIKSEKRYKLAEESARIGIWEWDIRSHHLYWSDEIYRLFDKEKSENPPTFKDMMTNIIDEDRFRTAISFDEAIEKKLPFEIEFRIKNSRDETVWVNAKGNTQFDAMGKPNLAAGTMQDVTTRKEMEEALQSTNQKYELISKFSTDVIWLMDIRTEKLTYISPSILKLNGYTSEEMMNRRLSDILTPESYEKAKTYLKQGIPDYIEGRPSTSFVLELDQKRKDGSIIATEVTSSVVYDDQGNLQLVGISRDITKRKMAETALREERNLFQILMDNIPDAIYFKNLKSRFIRINKAEAQVFGFKDPAQAVGKTDFDIFTKEHAEPAYEDEQEIIRTGKPLIDYEEQETFPDGHTRWISTSKMPFRNSAGEIAGTFGISHDITHRKEMELALQKRISELETVYYLANRVQAGETLQELLQTLLEETLKVINATDGGIFLLEPASRKLILYSAAGWFEQLAGLALEPDDGINGHVFSTNQPYFTSDMKSDAILSSKVKHLIRENQSGAFYPIQCSEGTIGVFDVFIPQPKEISENKKRLLSIIAQMAGEAILRSRLTEEIRQSNKTLQEEVNQRIAFQSLLATEKELLRTTLMSIGEGVIITNPEGRIMLFNHSAEDITGYGAKKITNQPVSKILKIIDPDTNQVIPDPLHKLYYLSRGNQEDPGDKPLYLITENGDRILISLNITALISSDRKKLGHVIVFRDITEKQRAEAQSALSQKMEAIGQLAAGIAHEINTPIQYVGDNLHFLQKAITHLSEMVQACNSLENTASINQEDLHHLFEVKKQSKIQHYITESPNAVQEALDGVERVRKIVLAMREFSHPSEKEKKLADINHGIETTVVISRNEWKYFADLETNLDPELPPVYCQIDEINQVILNMIINAVQAIQEVFPPGSDKKGKITITTKNADDRAVIKIHDNGNGIPDEIIRRIYDPFFTTKGIGKGTGQGLSLAHQIIVKKHRGSINVESKVGVGTTFIIEIPYELPDLET